MHVWLKCSRFNLVAALTQISCSELTDPSTAFQKIEKEKGIGEDGKGRKTRGGREENGW